MKLLSVIIVAMTLAFAPLCAFAQAAAQMVVDEIKRSVQLRGVSCTERLTSRSVQRFEPHRS